MRYKFPGHLLLPSTRAFITEARRTPGYSFSDWLHGYIYARRPHLYIGVATGEHRLVRCMGCGVCVSRCNREALSLERDPYRGKPLEIFELLSNAEGAGSRAPVTATAPLDGS